MAGQVQSRLPALRIVHTDEHRRIDRQTYPTAPASCQTKFLPEFLNRVDDTIVFHPLQREQIRSIVKLQLNRLEKQLEQSQIRMHVSEAAIDHIAEEGYDPAFGARPLKRVIQREIQNPLATELLKGNIAEGGSVSIDFRDDQFVFEPIEALVTAEGTAD